MSSPRHFRTISGTQVVLGKELARGGEGVVYEVDGNTRLVAKIYHSDRATERESKVKALVAAGLHSTAPHAAFPIEALFTSSNKFVGFTMRRVGQQRPVHNLYSPTSRRVEFPGVGFPFLLKTAINISRAVGSIHQGGCVIGDVNQSGFLIGNDATATLIDCDSFQIKLSGNLFLCTVGMPEFTPPELQDKSLNQIERTNNHDCFGLAILIFHLLFMGRHPFAGRFTAKGDMPLERAIKEFRFAYSCRSAETKMEPPPSVPLLSDVPKQMADAFERSFGQIGVSAGRPNAVEWASSLKSAEKELRLCDRNKGHHYFRTAQTCPWCRMEQGYAGFIAFAPPIAPTSTTVPINLAQLIAAIQSVPDPGVAPALPSLMPQLQLAPTAKATQPIWTPTYLGCLAASFAGRSFPITASTWSTRCGHRHNDLAQVTARKNSGPVTNWHG